MLINDPFAARQGDFDIELLSLAGGEPDSQNASRVTRNVFTANVWN
jgi:hypothetical protein